MGLLHRLAENPRSFTWLRKIAEADFVAVRRLVQKRLSTGGGALTLDLGCGTGEISPLFADHGYIGVDVSRRYADYARRRFPGKRFLVADGSRLPFRGGSFDQVLVFGVLHHMDDALARSVLQECARVLGGGGHLLLIEDSAEVPGWNLAGRLIHSMDEGENIRAEPGYAKLWEGCALEGGPSARFRSGFCDYYAFLLEKTG